MPRYRFIFVADLSDDADPDDFIQHGSEMIFPNSESAATYVPEGSHWEEVNDEE